MPLDEQHSLISSCGSIAEHQIPKHEKNKIMTFFLAVVFVHENLAEQNYVLLRAWSVRGPAAYKSCTPWSPKSLPLWPFGLDQV